MLENIHLQLKSFFQKNITYIEVLIISVMAFVAFFVDRQEAWFHWPWISYLALTGVLLLIKFIEHRDKNLTPLDKVKKYLLDFEGWVQTRTEYTDYYKSAPEFTVRTNEDDNHLDFTQEWTRGEIGAHYDSGNDAYYREIYFNSTLLKQIHIVIFDGGEKTIVAPDWEAIGRGRIYFYLKDSIEYFYQEYLTHLYGNDFSKNIRKSGKAGSFDIPVFNNSREMERFKEFCEIQKMDPPEQNRDQQNEIFYRLIDKYAEFKN